ncbi:hypothetical protein OOK29_10105 [Streptomyces phaeochromogenes]|uniref:hypothetical protein n=1 Tax=Streptomyces phaeochromogenes TaxID=1923 RepID=UPI00224FD2E2|nr:hypothetical protein [Streptomyces phaeochromogenes]MCX5598492.1 hypothetical protein [Streptomyces phaeochromogenes]
MSDLSVKVSLEIKHLTRAETASAIDAAPHGATVQLDVIHPDDRRAGWRYDMRVTSLTMTGGRDLITAVHQHMDDVHEQGEGK